MKWRLFGLTLVPLAFALAVSCASDDSKTLPDAPSAGAAGEGPSSSGGSSSAPEAGSGGSASGASGAGAEQAGATSGGSSGASDGGATSGGADTSSGGSPEGSGGAPSLPDGPVSACGAGKYDAGEPGCTTCPALPNPNPAASIDCQSFTSGDHTGEGELRLVLALPIHEPFSGEVNIDWVADSVPGSATVTWEYSNTLQAFVFHLPVEARYADEFTLGSWSFADACGFQFSASNFHVYWDVESWQCGQPT